MGKASETVQVAAATISAVAAAVALFAAYGALEESRKSNAHAEDAIEASNKMLNLADAAEKRLERHERGQYAYRVYLGEPTQAAYERHPVDEGSGQRIWRVVVNASGLQVENVWVEDETGTRSVNIYGLQRCSMYAMPRDFLARYVYFTDPYGAWRRPWGGQVEAVSPQQHPMPAEDTDDPAWWEPVSDCTG